MELDKVKSVYFIGIGGIGMSALARYFLYLGVKVSGYDKTATWLTDQLVTEGMDVYFSDGPELLQGDIDLVIYTPAVPASHPAFSYYSGKGVPVKKRAEILGMITGRGKTIAIAGTHGKTTTATLVTHILQVAGYDFMAFLGGISKNYNSNFIIGNNKSINQQINKSINYFIVEADEYDKSFLQLHPQVALITSADADHLDIYGGLDELRSSFREFAGNIKDEGSLILKSGVDLSLRPDNPNSVYSYQIEPGTDYCAANVQVNNGSYHFDMVTPSGRITDLSVGIPGRFNLENAIGAAAIADHIGIPNDVIRASLKSYQGVRRRFDLQISRPDFVYMDDYAHHPEELKACINAVREIYPGRKITGVFQPHLFSRTRDLADDFARSLELLDEIILLDIYPAREMPVKGVDSNMLLNKIKSQKKSLCTKEDLVEKLIACKPDVLLTLGAGDIDQMVEPIKRHFEI
jgi:UDP-N-acetylmuramate--alanine ligase